VDVIESVAVAHVSVEPLWRDLPVALLVLSGVHGLLMLSQKRLLRRVKAIYACRKAMPVGIERLASSYSFDARGLFIGELEVYCGKIVPQMIFGSGSDDQ
jgi:hypothetical protein